jgi:hypothetical protein
MVELAAPDDHVRASAHLSLHVREIIANMAIIQDRGFGTQMSLEAHGRRPSSDLISDLICTTIGGTRGMRKRANLGEDPGRSKEITP